MRFFSHSSKLRAISSPYKCMQVLECLRCSNAEFASYQTRTDLWPNEAFHLCERTDGVTEAAWHACGIFSGCFYHHLMIAMNTVARVSAGTIKWRQVMNSAQFLSLDSQEIFFFFSKVKKLEARLTSVFVL